MIEPLKQLVEITRVNGDRLSDVERIELPKSASGAIILSSGTPNSVVFVGASKELKDNANLVFLTPTAALGIGLPNPTANVHAARSDGNYQFKSSSASKTFGWGTTGNDFFLDDVTHGARRVSINNTGQFQIGLQTVDGNPLLYIGKSGQASLDLHDASGAASRWRIFAQTAGGIGGNASFGFYNVQNGATPLVFNEAGNVGIGVTDPEAKLELMGGYFRVRDNGTNNAPGAVGRGLEFVATGGQSIIQSYDRAGAAFLPLQLQGSYINLATTDIRVTGTKVLGSRITGWNAPTGTKVRGTFSSSGTIAAIGAAVGALIEDLRTHGLIGI